MVSAILVMLIAFPVLAQQRSVEMVGDSDLSHNSYNAVPIIHNNASGDNSTVLPVTLEVVDKPDLVISEKQESWQNLETRRYWIHYTVQNVGSAVATNSVTALSIDTVPWSNYLCPSLAPGASHNDTVGPFTMSGNSDTIELCADKDDVVDEANEGNNCLENTLTFPTTSYNITLAAGWNLISPPLIPDNIDIDSVISDSNLTGGDAGNIDPIYWYDPATDTWIYRISGMGLLTTMEDGKGYWVYATVADTLTIHGTEAASPGPDYPVLADWNMVGFTSITDIPLAAYLASVYPNYSTVYCWNAVAGDWSYWMLANNTFDTLNPGYGYWLYMTAGGTITPP